jgi:hypothetical protein
MRGTTTCWRPTVHNCCQNTRKSFHQQSLRPARTSQHTTTPRQQHTPASCFARPGAVHLKPHNAPASARVRLGTPAMNTSKVRDQQQSTHEPSSSPSDPSCRFAQEAAGLSGWVITEAGSYRQAVQRSKRHSSSSQQVRMACVPCRPPFRVASANTPLTLSRKRDAFLCKRARRTHGTGTKSRHSKQKTAGAAAITHRPSGASPQKRALWRQQRWPTLTSGVPHPQHAPLPPAVPPRRLQHPVFAFSPSERERNGFSTHQGRIPPVPAHTYTAPTNPCAPTKQRIATWRQRESRIPRAAKRPTPAGQWGSHEKRCYKR